jgi:hypothetical protein
MIAGRVGYADFSISKNGTLLYALNLAEKCRYELRGPYPAGTNADNQLKLPPVCAIARPQKSLTRIFLRCDTGTN